MTSEGTAPKTRQERLADELASSKEWRARPVMVVVDATGRPLRGTFHYQYGRAFERLTRRQGRKQQRRERREEGEADGVLD